jgi:hypothetical protein
MIRTVLSQSWATRTAMSGDTSLYHARPYVRQLYLTQNDVVDASSAGIRLQSRWCSCSEDGGGAFLSMSARNFQHVTQTANFRCNWQLYTIRSQNRWNCEEKD